MRGPWDPTKSWRERRNETLQRQRRTTLLLSESGGGVAGRDERRYVALALPVPLPL